MAIKNIVVLLMVWAMACVVADDTSSYLWNLDDDPYEETNLYDDDDYSAMREYLISELKNAIYNQTTECDGDTTDELSSVAEAAFEECGGVCTYIDNTYEMDIEQIYYPSDPPHIVFMLVDDWGYNDVGATSTYMNWTTPNIDSFISEGITFSNYFTHFHCVPTRGAFLTGRTANRLGQSISTSQNCELPLSEVTIAQEMKSAGYRTYIVGKWDVGLSSDARTPMYRGFDYFYGYYTGLINYYTKYCDYKYFDLQNNGELETSHEAITMHSALLFQEKVEAVIADHAANYSSYPMFLYYALQLIHYPLKVPSVYSDRCSVSDTDDTDDYDQEEFKYYCGLNLMLNEAVANTTCVLESEGMIDSTYVILAADNGGVDSITGNSLPFKGHKFDFSRGGVSAHAYLFSRKLSSSLQGSTYAGLMHVSDWLPTLMHIATEGEWTGSYSNATLDGVDHWNAIKSLSDSSPRSLIVHYAYYGEYYTGSIQYESWKLDLNVSSYDKDYPLIVDEVNDDWYLTCSDPTYSDSASTIQMLLAFPSESNSVYLFAMCAAIIAALVVTIYVMLQSKPTTAYIPIAEMEKQSFVDIAH